MVNQKAFDGLDAATKAAVLKVAEAAQTRGWQTSEQKDAESLKELQAKGMNVDRGNDGLKRELKVIGGRMTTDWLRSAGDDGKAIIDAYKAAK